MLKVLSLFDGMSCGQIALNRLGLKIDSYKASEIDKYAMTVTKSNYPDTIYLGDVRDVTVREHFDLIMFGSPCQGFSFSGNHLNFDDPRSKLFFEAVRILGQARQINPDVKFLMENVRMKKESMEIITDALGVDPVAINSNLVSAQNRHRLYWTNLGVDGLPQDRGIKLKDIIEGDHTNPKIRQIPRGWNKGGLKALDGKVPSLTTSGWQHNNHLTFDEGLTYRKLTPLECERLQTVPENYTNYVSDTQRYKMLGNGWTVDIICHLLKNIIN